MGSRNRNLALSNLVHGGATSLLGPHGEDSCTGIDTLAPWTGLVAP